jgi:hypothetical protein
LREYPKLFDAGDYNLFRYCHNDPVDHTDPMGLEELDIEFRAFIPQASVGIYRGDSRGFSTDRNASSRVSVSVRVETDPGKNHGNSMIGKPTIKISPTHNNLTGRESTSSGPKTPQVTATEDKNGNVNVNVQMNMRNPEQQVLGHGVGQGIRSDVNISVDQKATKASVDGTVSRSPAFEANFTRQDGQTTNAPLQNAARNPVDFIINLQKTSEIHHPIDLPPRNNQ